MSRTRSEAAGALLVVLAGWAVLVACGQLNNDTKPEQKTAVWTEKPQTVEPNADVIWMVLPVNAFTARAKGDESPPEQKTFFGLFACYRATQAEPASAPAPVCKLAKLDTDVSLLNWPGVVVLKDGSLAPK